MLLLSVIAGGQTEARATIIIDHYSPFDQGFRAVSFRNNRDNPSILKHCTELRADMIFTRGTEGLLLLPLKQTI